MRYLCLMFLILLAGCGGGNGSTVGQPLNLLPFDTSRIGRWTGPMHGPLVLNIAANRMITGTWQADTGTSWTISGQTSDPIIHDNGISLNFTNSQPASKIYGTGILLVRTADHLTGTLSLSGDLQATYSVDLARQ